MSIAVWSPLGYAGAGTASVASALAVLRTRMPSGPRTAAAAGALGAIVAVDLAPDLVREAHAAHASAALPLATALVTTILLMAGARLARHASQSDSFGAVVGAPFLAHSLVEGVAAGAALGWRSSVGLGLVAALVIHKAAEGADLGACLSRTTCVPSQRTDRAWVIANGVTPLIGICAALAVPMPERISLVAMTAICCLLVRACLMLLRRGYAATTLASTAATALASGLGAALVLLVL